VSERRQLAWAMQRALLIKAHQAREATEYVLMGQYATRALNFYSSYPSDDFLNSCVDYIDLAHQKQNETASLVKSLQTFPISEPINSKQISGIRS